MVTNVQSDSEEGLRHLVSALQDASQVSDPGPPLGRRAAAGGAHGSRDPGIRLSEERPVAGASNEKLSPLPGSHVPVAIELPILDTFSNSEPEYGLVPEHFSPRTAEVGLMVHDEVKRRWTRKHTLILAMAMLSMVLATIAAYVALLKRSRIDEERGGASARHAKIVGRSAYPENVAHRYRARQIGVVRPLGRDGGKAAVPRIAEVSAGTTSDGGVNGHLDARPGPRPARDHGSAVQTLSADLLVVSTKGTRSRRDIDVITVPTGATVLCGKRVMGLSPLRLRFGSARKCHLILNHAGRRVVDRVVTIRRFGDHKLKVYLPRLAHSFRKAKRGRTSLDVRCSPPGAYRIYVNGRDTGWNCPARIHVDMGSNDMGLYLMRGRRVMYKRFRVHAGHTVVINGIGAGL